MNESSSVEIELGPLNRCQSNYILKRIHAWLKLPNEFAFFVQLVI